ncbi:MAG: LPS export ABC transporter periplasmic protein LptC [Candidatus Eremiobacteraeota bacterium]|nr:LPS export ABC transporter periplasmic protein LptC [Candidatus Eremiobacteraeota bacterium]
MNRSLALVVLVALLAAGPKLPSHPAPSADSGTTFNVGVWTVHMSSVDVGFKTGDFSTPNAVTMTREGGDINGDRANGNYKTRKMALYGHVVMHDSQGNFAGLSDTKPTNSRGPATLTADQVQIDGAAKIYTAIGNVHYVQADTTVDASKGTLNDGAHDLDLQGNVHIVQGERNMVADHVRYNTVTGQAHAEGNVTMQFPSQINPHLATPRPIHIKNPLVRPTQKPLASPSP